MDMSSEGKMHSADFFSFYCFHILSSLLVFYSLIFVCSYLFLLFFISVGGEDDMSPGGRMEFSAQRVLPSMVALTVTLYVWDGLSGLTSVIIDYA
jgi:hypothetical protein